MKIVLFSTKPYDKIWFEPLSGQYGMEVKFLEPKLDEDTVFMAKGSELVCAFVNDILNDKVIADIRPHKLPASCKYQRYKHHTIAYQHSYKGNGMIIKYMSSRRVKIKTVKEIESRNAYYSAY